MLQNALICYFASYPFNGDAVMTDYQAQVEAFLARGGKITRAAEGEGLNLSAKDWYNKVSDGPAVVTIIEETVCEDGNLLAEDAYREAKMSGASDSAAWEEYDYARKGE